MKDALGLALIALLALLYGMAIGYLIFFQRW